MKHIQLILGSNAETRRSNFPVNGISTLPNEPQMISKNGDHEKSPDPYLLGRLMGSSYANYPSAFTIASRGASNPLSSQQLLMSQNKTNRGFNMKSSDEPIYVPGAYMVMFIIQIRSFRKDRCYRRIDYNISNAYLFLL